MTPPPSEFPADDPQSDLRRTLAKRLAMAGGLVAVLLGGLALFDHLTTAEDTDEGPAFSSPVPVAPRKELTQPVTAAPPEPAPEAKPEASTPSAPEGTAGANVKETLPEPSQAESVSSGAARGPRAPQKAGNAGVTNSAPSAAPNPAPAQKAPQANAPGPAPVAAPSGPAQAPAVNRSSIPDEAAIAAAAPGTKFKEAASPATAPPSVKVVTPPATNQGPAPAAPAPVAKPAAPAPSHAPVTVPRLFSGFMLQAGVFSSTQSAEELHAKLTLNGIPSTLETRVHVGPFKTKEEAEAAQHKMQALGIDPVLIPPKGAKR